MAETELLPELADLKLDLSDVQNPSINKLSNQNGLSDWQRFVTKNFFDTQPKRRAAYLKRLGYELKPGSMEEYRPMGSDGNYQPIEPDNTVLGFIPVYNLFTEDGRKELGRDLGDIAFDTVVAGPATGIGAQIGAMGGRGVGMAGGPVGAVLGTVGGASAGAAAGNVAAEAAKTGIGDFFLDESVPIDLQETTYQSLAAGALAGVGQAGSSMIQAWKKAGAKGIQASLKEAAVRKSNGTWNMELANDLAKNPEKYTPEAVKGANNKLLTLSDDIFGTSAERPKSTRDLKGGVAKNAIDPLNRRADLEIDKLALNPEANFTVEELAKTLRDRVAPLANKRFKTQDEERALKFFQDEVDDLLRKTEISGPMNQSLNRIGEEGASLPSSGYGELTFKEGRDLLKRWQNAAYEEGAVKDNGIVKSVTHGLKELADVKAGGIGSDLPAINEKRSKILTTYSNMQSLIKDGSMQSAFVGKDSIAKERVKRMFSEMDSVLDTNMSQEIESTQFRAAVERVYESPSAFGSGSVITDALKQGGKGAAKGAFQTATVAGAASTFLPLDVGTRANIVGIAAGVGGVKGFAKGAREGASFSSPDRMIKSFSKVRNRLDDLNADQTIADAARKGLLSPAAQLAQQVPPVSEEVKRFVRGETPSEVAPQSPPLQPGGEQDPNVQEEDGLLPELQNLKLQMP